MATPQWLASAQNGNALPGGTPSGSSVTKVGGTNEVFDATARTRDVLPAAGSFTFKIDPANEMLIGLTNQTESAGLVAANMPVSLSIAGGYGSVLHGASYAGDWTPSQITGLHTAKIEVFDNGGGTFRAKFYRDGVLQFTSTVNLTLPLALGINISTLGAVITEIDGVGMSLGNAAPVVNAGVDLDLLEGQVANLAGVATDDGLPSGILTYAWTKVSGPGTVTFGNAALASTSASFSALGVYVLRLTVSDGQLSTSDDISVSVTASPTKPVAPTTYDLKTDAAVYFLPALPSFGAAGDVIVDPIFATPIRRLTDQNTSGGSNWGTPSGPATNAWASDDRAFMVVNDDGSNYKIFNFDPILGVHTAAESFAAGTEPTFSRSIARPHILYGTQQSNSQLIKQFNRLTQSWSTLYDLRDDVASLVSGGSTYMGACYTSEDDPERICVIYGAAQDTHPYCTIFDATNPANRVTLDVKLGKIKVNGGAWGNLLDYTGAAIVPNVGLHSSNIDKTGKWVYLSYSGADGGAKRSAFFNMATLRLHEFNHNKWFGHSSMGDRTYVSQNSLTDAPYQWTLTDLEQGGVFPLDRALISPPFTPAEWYLSDHNSWNNRRTDGVLVPIITGTQHTQGGIGGPSSYANEANWNALWEEIAAIATAPGKTKGVDMFYRACHHRVSQLDAGGNNIYTFRDSPRPQVSHGGMWVLFTSNWGLSLGTYGAPPKNHRRDCFMVRMSRTVIQPPVEPPPETPTPGTGTRAKRYGFTEGAFFHRRTAPGVADQVIEGDLWYDRTARVLKIATSVTSTTVTWTPV